MRSVEKNHKSLHTDVQSAIATGIGFATNANKRAIEPIYVPTNGVDTIQPYVLKKNFLSITNRIEY